MSKTYRPTDTEDLCDALENGETCEIPTRFTMAAFRALAASPGKLRAEIEEDEDALAAAKAAGYTPTP